MARRPARVDEITESGNTPLGRDFAFYATGQAVSVVGDRVAIIALVFLVIHLSRSFAPALALFYICRVLPTLLGGLIVGVLVDHFDRRRLMVGCDLARAALLVFIPTIGAVQLWALYPMVFVLYALTLLFDTAADAAVPDVVAEEAMTSANAVLRSIQTVGDFAYAAGGALVFLLKLQVPFYIDAATFLVSALMITAMRIPRRPHEALPDPRAVWPRITAGISFVLAHPFLKWSTITFAIAPFAGGAVFVLAPLYADTVLRNTPDLIGPLSNGAVRFSLMEVSLGVGALAGSWATTRAAARWPRGRLFGVGMAGLGVAYAAVAVGSNFFLTCGLLLAAGFCNSLFVISGMTLVQTITPSEMRGRVVAARATVINGSLALGSAAAGILLTVLSYRLTWAVTGAIIGVSSLCIWLHHDVRDQP